MIEVCCSLAAWGLTTPCGNKDHWRCPPPSTRIGTGTVRVQTLQQIVHVVVISIN